MKIATRKPKARPRPTRDREATQRKLISAAEAMFAEHGFKGTTLDRLAAETGANRALVSYYFGSKEGLYDAVIGAMTSDVVADVKVAAEEGDDPEEMFRNYILTLARAFAARPAFPAILMREYISGGMQEREGPFRQVFQFYQMTKRLYDRGRRLKAFRKFDPHILHLSIVGPLVHFVITIGHRERVFDKLAKEIENPTVDEFAKHLSSLILDGIQISQPK